MGKGVLCILALVISSFTQGQNVLISKRLAKVQNKVELTYNDKVEHSINRYLQNPEETSSILGLSALHLKDLEDSFKVAGLPVELRYLAASLSKYNNWMVSEDGGSGIWQMRYIIAKKYGLNISSYVDERRDIGKSTSASIQHFKYLHSIYDDWLLVIAAFYSNDIEINKAIRMSGGKRKYWEIHEFLPTRYQKTIPNFIASTYIHSYFGMHNISPKKLEEEGVEMVPITEWTTIYQISQALEIDFDKLRDLNAIYKKQVIPHTQKDYYLRLPFDKVGRFYSLGDSVYRFESAVHGDTSNEPRQSQIPNPHVEEPEITRNTGSTTSGTKTLYYTVKKGDYLGKIADLYDVSISSVRRWNGIKGDQININQRLKIHVPASSYSKYKGYNSLSHYQKQQLINKD